MKALSCCIPGDGGMYTANLTLRRALALHGVELAWFEAGHSAAALVRQSAGEVELLATDTDNEKARAQALLGYIEREKPGLLIANVLGGAMEANLVRYLPAELPRILIVHSISRATYKAARAVRDWVDATVAVSPRIRHDLIRHEGFRAGRVHVIPNSVAPDFAPRSPRDPVELRVLSLGRVEHSSKGVNWLPEIVRYAVDAGQRLSLTIAGEGPDLEQLKNRMSRCGAAGRVEYLGLVPRDRVPALMRSHDVLLLPSIFEGLSISLLEAMAGGCVPVASRIHGVTDYVIAEGRTGLLFPVGDPRAAAASLVELGSDRHRLCAMSEAARQAVRRRFTVEAQGAAFHRVIEQICLAPRCLKQPLPIDRWRMPWRLRPGWLHALPAPVKDVLRVARDRLQTASAR